MKDNASIYLVYGQRVENQDSRYYGLQLFCDDGLVDEEKILAAYESEVDTWVPQKLEDRVGPFTSLESLQKFSFNLCERAKSKNIVLLSIDSYNEAVEKCANVEQLFEEFNKVGDCISNVDKDGPKGILGRIFY